MRNIALVLCLVALSGCTSTEVASDAPSSMTGVELGDLSGPGTSSGRFMGNFRDSLDDHVNDCIYGWSITTTAISRQTARDWDRMVRFFE